MPGFWAGTGAALASGAVSAFGAHQANLAAGRVRQGTMDYNTWVMAENQRYQKEMSNSAHQRQVVDMRKAGLNPILSVTGGSGASSGAASGAGAPMYQPQSVGGAAASSAIAARTMVAQNRLLSAQADKEEAIADVYNKVGPAILGGIDAVGSAAKGLGVTAGRIEEAIRDAIKKLAPGGNVSLGAITTTAIEALDIDDDEVNSARQAIRRRLDAIGGPSDWIDSARRRYFPSQRKNRLQPGKKDQQ